MSYMVVSFSHSIDFPIVLANAGCLVAQPELLYRGEGRIKHLGYNTTEGVNIPLMCNEVTEIIFNINLIAYIM